jgi:hypothetical protein
MAQRKEIKTKITVRDLKPKKDAKGGVSVDHNTQTHTQNRNVQNHNVQNRNMNHMGW